MPRDPRIGQLATDRAARVMVFVDGQNLYKACEKIFGHPLAHPHLLAQHLAGDRTQNRLACRFYTGRPDPNVPGERTKVRNIDRRIAAMQRVGVTVVTRKLRYHWDWGHRQDLPESGPNVTPQTVTLRPWQRPQEKGIDLAIGLELVEFVLTDCCDVAVVVSLDRDLAEIPRALRNLQGLIDRPMRLEAAVPVSAGLRYPKTIPGFHHTHQITPEVFELIRDDTDYTVSEADWQPPELPTALPDPARE